MCNDYSSFHHHSEVNAKSGLKFIIVVFIFFKILIWFYITILLNSDMGLYYNFTIWRYITILQMTSLEVLQVVKTRDLLVIREIIMMIMIWILGKNTHTLSRCRPDVLYVTYMYKRWHYTLPYERNFYVETFIKMQEFNLAMVTL